MTPSPSAPLARVFPIAFAALLATGCSAHLVSTPVPLAPAGEKQVSEGMFYTLPRTVVTATVPVKVTIAKEGDLADFAPLFAYEQWRNGEVLDAGRKLTVDPASFGVRGEPDPAQVYYLETSGRGAIDRALTFAFTEEGAVTGLKAEVTNRTADVVLAGVSGVTSVLTKTVLGSGAATWAAEEVELDCDEAVSDENDDAHFRKCFLGADRAELQEAFDLLGEEQRAPLLSAYRGEPNPGEKHCGPQSDETARKLQGKCFRRSLNQARATYDLFAKLVEARNGALAEPNAAYEGYAAALAKNEELAKALVARFTGKKSDVEWKAVFEVVPGRDDTSGCPDDPRHPCESWQSEELLVYSVHGICAHADLRGAPKPDEKLRTEDCGDTASLRLRFTLDPADDQPVVRRAAGFQEPSPAGLYYRVPARMRVELIETDRDGNAREGVEHGETRLMIAQHGIVAAMPSEMGGKAVTHDLAFYGDSGGVKTYSLTSKGMIDKGMVDSISSSTNALLDARNKQIEAERAAADEAKQIAAQKDLLENLVKIQDACAKLENPPEECN